ncbi:hypothetical protein AVHY2522_06525 [Acidovorax sp. SUPP2522]|jgi:putative transcriptional regulator|uniref:helix-turn-helix domain-containing protein n=1 Tax=unclassified Acidovorax TaxID=2684926 RepID=UPI00234A32DC|nr:MULTISPECIES: helix-turn-helix transcriptional regulator [unclassified Acidovorax]WCM96386.1 helix-turn-helix transcriptional regulator [Acidovorax sp. GBBC 1281]GKT14971.1 hypothetical protein AVHY2522_06525 [Acidovorax sp. SUPP2522]
MISYKIISISLLSFSNEARMIRIHLSRLLGENKEKLADLIRSTGLARNTVAGLYHETTSRLDIETLNAICQHYQCGVADLLEYVPEPEGAASVGEKSSSDQVPMRRSGKLS